MNPSFDSMSSSGGAAGQDIAAAMITVRTDLGPQHIPAGSTVGMLMTLLEAERPSLAQAATAVNGHFVARSARAAHVLQDGDALLCFSPITGG